jgi:hypothetical protein
MAVERRYLCDRCGRPITEGRTNLVARCGPLRRAGRESVDLCRDCGERFAEFLREPAAADIRP